MSGNTPNVSRNNYSYSHALSGGKAVLYDGVSLQQGVPVVDSDINEFQDYRRMNEQLFNKALIASNSGILFGSTPALSGFSPYQATSPINNFGLRAGYAVVEGVVIPTTTATTPAAFDYKDQVLYSGIFTGISGSDLEDTSKNWSSSDQLTVSIISPKHVACIVKITSGTENGNWGYITGYTATTITIDTVTQVNRNDGTALKTLITPSNINIGDTYEIYVPPLTTPGGSRTDYVYLQVWFDDISEDEDASIVNTDVGVEAVHKIAKRWVVRVSEDGTLSFTSSFTDFNHKYFPYAYFSRTAGIANITSAMINLNATTRAFGNLTQINPTAVEFDFTVMAGAGYHTGGVTANVYEAINLIASELYSVSAGYGASRVRNAAISGTPDTLPSGSIATMISSLLGFVNNRIREYEPTIAADLLSGGPVLLWRSHGAVLDASVTRDTVSIYAAQTSGGEGGIVELVGGYLSGANCYRAPTGTAPDFVTMKLHTRSEFLEAFKISPSATPWTWASASSWDSYLNSSSGISTYKDKNLALTDSIMYLNGGHLNVSSGPSTTPRKIVSSETSTTVPASSSRPGIWMSSDGMWITQNCYYSGGFWNAHDSGRNSLAMHVTDLGIIHYYKLYGENATPWARTGVSTAPATDKWTYSLTNFAGSSAFASLLEGAVQETIPFAYVGYCPAGDGLGSARIPICFNIPRKVAPAVPVYGVGIVLDYSVNTDITTVLLPTYIASASNPERGGYLLLNSISTTAGDAFHGHGWISFV